MLRSGQSNRPKRISSRDGEMHFCHRPRSTSDAKMGGEKNMGGVVKRAFRLSLEAKYRSDATGGLSRIRLLSLFWTGPLGSSESGTSVTISLDG